MGRGAQDVQTSSAHHGLVLTFTTVPGAADAPQERPSDWDRPLEGLVEPLGAVGTDVYVVTRAVPRGPRGLWASLVAATSAPATTGRDLDDELIDLVAHEGPATDAHLGYLASLA